MVDPLGSQCCCLGAGLAFRVDGNVPRAQAGAANLGAAMRGGRRLSASTLLARLGATAAPAGRVWRPCSRLPGQRGLSASSSRRRPLRAAKDPPQRCRAKSRACFTADRGLERSRWGPWTFPAGCPSGCRMGAERGKAYGGQPSGCKRSQRFSALPPDSPIVHSRSPPQRPDPALNR